MTRIIYLDLDGVLADFHNGFSKVVGRSPGDFTKDEMWAHVATIPDFFLTLDVTAEGKALFALAQNHGEVRILTAIPREASYPSAAEEKVKWTCRHFGDVPVTVVRYARQKADYARPQDILVDDSPDNICRWIECGGQGIVHTSLDSTMAAMLEIVNRVHAEKPLTLEELPDDSFQNKYK